MVGGWRTRVEAIEVFTYGIGGDSYIHFDKDGELIIGPERVLPISKITHDYPYLIEEIQHNIDLMNLRSGYLPTDCFLLTHKNCKNELNEIEREFVDFLQAGPRTIGSIIKTFKRNFYKLHIDNLINNGLIVKASITPTDLMHASDQFAQWNVNGAKKALEILSFYKNMTCEEFLSKTLNVLTNKLAAAVLESLLYYDNSIKSDNYKEMKDLINMIIKQNEDEILTCHPRIKYPIVAVGAPVAAYFPRVANKLNALLIIPEYAEVANAIGAATGKVIYKIEALVKTTIDNDIILHAPWERKVFCEFEEAIKYSIDKITNYAIGAAADLGIADYNIHIDQKDAFIESNCERDHRVHLETSIRATVVGNPKFNTCKLNRISSCN
jgi:N-methylhydantoinase A/oxoprolinase/acetone carboxylase beta subunit